MGSYYIPSKHIEKHFSNFRKCWPTHTASHSNPEKKPVEKAEAVVLTSKPHFVVRDAHSEICRKIRSRNHAGRTKVGPAKI